MAATNRQCDTCKRNLWVSSWHCDKAQKYKVNYKIIKH